VVIFSLIERVLVLVVDLEDDIGHSMRCVHDMDDLYSFVRIKKIYQTTKKNKKE
jgi:hypothetical protein